MKVVQYFAAAFFFLAGVVLLAAPEAHAGTPVTAAFVPTRFTVVDQGTVGKPDVVMIPGLGSSREVWAAEAKILAPRFRLHLVQVNGFAGQPAGVNAKGQLLVPIVEELHAYIAASTTKPVVMGHSMGGLLGMMLASKYPGDVSKLVIVDTLPYYAVVYNPAATVETMTPQVAAIQQQMEAMPDDQYAAMQPMMMKQMVSNAEGLKAALAWSMASDRTVVLNAMVEDLLTDMRPEVATIKVPVLMLYPYDATTQSADPAKVDALYQGAYKAMPNVTLVRVDFSRHFIPFDQPGKMDAAVEGFLK